MSDLNKATSVTRAKRGYRTIKMTLPVNEFDLLTRMGEASFRTADQQAAYFIHQSLVNAEVDAIKAAYNGAVEEREEAEVE